jgi:predicted DNA-binding transcriptional regulator AlpA
MGKCVNEQDKSPSLGELAAEPNVAEELTPGMREQLTGRCAHVLFTLLRVLAVPGNNKQPSEDGEKLLGVPEMARKLGRSQSWVEKHVNELPQRVSLCGLPKWKNSVVEKWLKSLPPY